MGPVGSFKDLVFVLVFICVCVFVIVIAVVIFFQMMCDMWGVGRFERPRLEIEAMMDTETLKQNFNF